jgi:hypothetical protein
MSDDPQSILERLDVRSIESEIARLLDVDPNVMRALENVARTVLERSSIDEDDRAYVEEAAAEWTRDAGFDSFKEAYFRERIVTCGNPAGLYELWGLDALELTGRGYVIDWGENPDDVRVWSTWTPTDDKVAFERAVIDAWGGAWESIGLPPFLGDCWQGNAPLVYRAVESLVSRSEDARGYFWSRFPEADDQKAEPDWALFGLPRLGASSVAKKPTEHAADALTDPAQRPALVALFLSLTRGCP